MKILLTGSTGMVGRNLLDHPEAATHEWLTPASRELNLLDAQVVLDYLQRHRPDCVIHAAGKVGGIQANMREPVGFLVDNLDMGRNVVLGALKAGVPRLLNFGSTCMYPRDRDGALQEGDILTGSLEPTNEGYALAKITVARLIDYVRREHPSLAYKTMIPCNLYGAHDKFDPRWSHMIPAVLHKLHEARQHNQSSVEIWGTGEARREFMFAQDLADAVYRALNDFDQVPDLMNIGLGVDHSVNDYYEIAAKVVGYTGGFHHDLTKPTGMQRKLADVSRANAWGWRSRYSLEEGLRLTYQHYLEHVANEH